MILGDSRYLLDDKVEQVLEQLKKGKVRVVFDFTSGTPNILTVSWG
jgi:uncharacterized protein YheU (UPF0270 family)